MIVEIEKRKVRTGTVLVCWVYRRGDRLFHDAVSRDFTISHDDGIQAPSVQTPPRFQPEGAYKKEEGTGKFE